jgi:hypothetical protein
LGDAIVQNNAMELELLLFSSEHESACNCMQLFDIFVLICIPRQKQAELSIDEVVERRFRRERGLGMTDHDCRYSNLVGGTFCVCSMREWRCWQLVTNVGCSRRLRRYTSNLLWICKANSNRTRFDFKAKLRTLRGPKSACKLAYSVHKQ